MFSFFLLTQRYILITSLILLSTGCVSNNYEIYLGNKDSGKIDNFDSLEIRKRHLDYLNPLRQETG